MDTITSKLKLAPVFILLAIVFVLFLNPFVIIPSGYVGVKKAFKIMQRARTTQSY